MNNYLTRLTDDQHLYVNALNIYMLGNIYQETEKLINKSIFLFYWQKKHMLKLKDLAREYDSS